MTTVGIIKRHRKRAGRTVINIIRRGSFEYRVLVSYSRGRTEWSERVLFDVQPYDKARLAVEVTDMDFPGDRKLSLVIDNKVDIPTFITNFILSGRW